MKNITVIVAALLLLVLGLVYILGNREEVKIPETPEDPYIVGQIYSISENSVLVAEGVDGEYRGGVEELRGNAVWVAIDENTEIIDADKSTVSFNYLEEGMVVEVSITGVLLESYPARGTAAKLVIVEQYAITECYIGGCSGELCVSYPEAQSTCELLPGMECLGSGMSCEFINGDCSWVLSLEAAECFAEVKEREGSVVKETRIGHLFEKAEELLN